jgi:hypothetical protein
MISTSAKLTGFDEYAPANGKNVRLKTDDLFSRQQMIKLGQVGRESIIARVRKGRGVTDAAMPRLKGANVKSKVKGQENVYRMISAYAGWKHRHGLNPWRDLWGAGKGGHMLDNFTVRAGGATADTIKIAFTSAKSGRIGWGGHRPIWKR